MADFVVFQLHRIYDRLEGLLAQVLGEEGSLEGEEQLNTIFFALWELWRGKRVHITHIVAIEHDLYMYE